MKTIILMAAMFLTAAFADPVGATTVTSVRGYIAATETYQVIGDNLVVDATGRVNCTLGRFTVTYHAEVTLATGASTGSAQFTAPNGDSFSATFIGQGIETGLPEVDAFITEIYTVTGGTGQFAHASGNFTIERLLHTTTGKTSGVFNGNISE